MPKLSLTLLITLMLFTWQNARAQQPGWLYSEDIIGHLSPELYLSPTSYQAQHMPDSIKLKFFDAGIIQQVIDRGLNNRVYAVEISIFNQPDMAAIISKLEKFPNLKYLTLTGWQGGYMDDKIYQIPPNIVHLQNLKGLEFAFTDGLDMEDALKKLIPLKQLKSLAITGYYHPLPSNLTELKQLDDLRLNTQNLRNIDLSNVLWQSVYLTNGQLTDYNKRFVDNGDDQKALSNLSKVASLQTLNLI